MNSAFHRHALAVIMFALSCASDSAVAAQDGRQLPEAAGDSDRSTVVVTGATQQQFPRISVQFEVHQPDGTFLLDATRADFRVTEDGKDVEILDFQAPRSTQAIPTTIVLVVDHSGSMEQPAGSGTERQTRIESLKRAVASFMTKLPEGSQVAVVGFSSQVNVLCGFTTDRDRVLTAVNRLRPGGATRFYDAVAEALSLLDEQTGRRALLAPDRRRGYG